MALHERAADRQTHSHTIRFRCKERRENAVRLKSESGVRVTYCHEYVPGFVELQTSFTRDSNSMTFCNWDLSPTAQSMRHTMRLSGKPPRQISRSKLFQSLQHPVLTEIAIAEIGFGVDLDFQLPGLLYSRRVDARGGQPTQMFVSLLGIDNLNGLVAVLESLFDEWKQHAVFFVVICEESTNMANCAKLGAG
jgi:hypothetical protein